MTTALCLNCGDLKFGAICPCPACKFASTGDMHLDILFSDHKVSAKSLKELGGVIKQISTHARDQNERIWTFLQYISIHHPSLLHITLDGEMLVRTQSILGSIPLPAIVLDIKFTPRPPPDAGAG